MRGIPTAASYSDNLEGINKRRPKICSEENNEETLDGPSTNRATQKSSNKRSKGPCNKTTDKKVAKYKNPSKLKTYEYSKNTRPMNEEQFNKYFEDTAEVTKSMPIKSKRGRGKAQRGGTARKTQNVALVAMGTPRHIPQSNNINLSESSSEDEI